MTCVDSVYVSTAYNGHVQADIHMKQLYRHIYTHETEFLDSWACREKWPRYRPWSYDQQHHMLQSCTSQVLMMSTCHARHSPLYWWRSCTTSLHCAKATARKSCYWLRKLRFYYNCLVTPRCAVWKLGYLNYSSYQAGNYSLYQITPTAIMCQEQIAVMYCIISKQIVISLSKWRSINYLAQNDYGQGFVFTPVCVCVTTMTRTVFGKILTKHSRCTEHMTGSID